MYNIEIINCLSDNYSYICFNDNEAFVVDPSEYTPIKNFLLEKFGSQIYFKYSSPS